MSSTQDLNDQSSFPVEFSFDKSKSCHSDESKIDVFWTWASKTGQQIFSKM